MEQFVDERGNWRFLPRAGGLLDQDTLEMEDLLTIRMADRARQETTNVSLATAGAASE
jgi:hypothetical protein